MAFPLGKNENMKRTVLESRRQVVSAVICSYPGGRECAAARLGMPLKKFDNHVYENAGSRPLSDEQLLVLEQEAGTRFYADFIAAQNGGVFVPVANPDEVDHVELYELSIKTAVKRGRVDQIIAEALLDGVIHDHEVVAILEAHRQHIAARYHEIVTVIALHRTKADK